MAEAGSPNSKRKDCKLLFIGSPLLDITVECNHATLETYALQPDGCVPWQEGIHRSLLESIMKSANKRLDSGGSAFNSAKIAKWVLGDTGNIAFSGCVGDDSFSSELRSSLESSGVNPLLISIPGKDTGLCICLLSPGGQRSMITRQGAAALFSTQHLRVDAVRMYIEASDCIFVVGYCAVYNPQIVQALAESCSSSQLFCLSLSAEYICRKYTNIILDVLPRVDILVGNKAEMIALAEAVCDQTEVKTVEEAVTAVKKLVPHDVRPWTIIVTRGSDSVILYQDDLPACYLPVPQNVQVVDSVGCGDALAGALLAVYTSTGDMKAAVRAGIQTAVIISQSPGCDPPPESFSF